MLEVPRSRSMVWTLHGLTALLVAVGLITNEPLIAVPSGTVWALVSCQTLLSYEWMTHCTSAFYSGSWDVNCSLWPAISCLFKTLLSYSVWAHICHCCMKQMYRLSWNLMPCFDRAWIILKSTAKAFLMSFYCSVFCQSQGWSPQIKGQNESQQGKKTAFILHSELL